MVCINGASLKPAMMAYPKSVVDVRWLGPKTKLQGPCIFSTGVGKKRPDLAPQGVGGVQGLPSKVLLNLNALGALGASCLRKTPEPPETDPDRWAERAS